MDLGLQGKVALVTGAARGIGWAIADGLSHEGAAVLIVDHGNFDVAEKRAAEIQARGGKAIALQCDVGRLDEVERVAAKAKADFGGIDILVNNAGTLSRKPIMEDALDDWDRVLKTNLYGCFHCARAIVPMMSERGWGRIINISSIHGHVAKAGMGSYCVSKSAIDMFTKQLAVELAPSGITVNAVAPGTISTEINIPLYKSNKPEHVALREATLKRVPVGRYGEPDEIGNAVKFLASEAAAYVTGIVLYVDGGYIAEGTPRQ